MLSGKGKGTKKQKITKPIEKPEASDNAGKEAELPIVEHGIAKEKPKWNEKKVWQFWKKGIGFKDQRKLKKKPDSSFLIRMFNSNGTSREFVVSTKNEMFEYNDRTYYLRYEDAWFNLTQNQFELNFFDDYATPLDRKIKKEGKEAYWSVTSENLKPIIDMNYVKVLASSQELDKMLRLTSTLCLLITLLSFISLYFLNKISKAITVLAGG